MTGSVERRFVSARHAQARVETRADGGSMIVGYGAVFYKAGDAGTEYQLAGDIKERIMPRAFDRALRERDDARGLFDHDSTNLLGRVSSGTMRLRVDAIGLQYEIDLPDTQLGRDLPVLIRRGDLTGSSFAFSMLGGHESWREDGDVLIREIDDIGLLWDTGPVTYPAYRSTTVKA